MEKNGRKLTERAKSRNLTAGLKPVDKGIRLGNNDEKAQLSFSFKYFKQIPYFQLGDQDNHWFIGVLDRLRDLSGKDSSIMGDATAKSSYRIHPIEWNQPHIPIKKDDLDWIPSEYRDNIEIEFLQFEITKSNGRVVGFFDETSEVFHVVLLDPKHNIQPTKATGYRVDGTHDCLTDYEELLLLLKNHRKCEHVDACPLNTKDVTKHLEQAERIIWIDKDMASVFDKFSIEDRKSKLEEFLLNEL